MDECCLLPNMLSLVVWSRTLSPWSNAVHIEGRSSRIIELILETPSLMGSDLVH